MVREWAGSQQYVSRRALAIAVVALAVLLAGCGSLGSEEPGLPDGETAAQQYDSLDTYSATFVEEFTAHNETDRTTGEVVVRTGEGQLYREVDRADQRRPRLLVSNGSVLWNYDEDRNRVTVITGTNPSRAPFDPDRDRIRRVVNRAQSDESRGLLPIPFTPVLSATDRLIEASAVTDEYDGVEAIGDREAHVISTRTEDGEVIQRIYLDTEWFLPLKVWTKRTIDGNQAERVYRLEDIEFNPGVEEGQFAFEVPPDATVERIDGIGWVPYDSRDALDAASNIRVPRPDFPGEFEFRDGKRAVIGDTEAVSLEYTSDVAWVDVRKENRTFEGPGDTDGEAVEVGDQTGAYLRRGSEATVSWGCEGNRYQVTGRLARGDLVAIAESIECA